MVARVPMSARSVGVVGGTLIVLAGLVACSGESDDPSQPGATGGMSGLPSGGAGGTTMVGSGGVAVGAGGGPATGGALGTGGIVGGTGGTLGTGGIVGSTGGTLGTGGIVGGTGGTLGTGGGDTGGTAGAGGTASTGGAPSHPDLGVGDGKDVVLLGDSWMSNTLQLEGTNGGIAPSLIQVSGKPYRNYAVQGVMMLTSSVFGAAIPTQWGQAKRANPSIKTVVMTGGGNDIIQNPTIQSSCTAGTDPCKQLLAKISAALDTLWTQMATDGVQDVVYIQYASDVGSTSPEVRKTQPIPSVCLTTKIRCHTYDTTAAVNKQIAGDGIHPLKAANDRIAKAVYELMTSEGIRR